VCAAGVAVVVSLVVESVCCREVRARPGSTPALSVIFPAKKLISVGQIDPSNSQLDLALDAISRADFPRAIEILSELAVEDADNAEVWRQLGLCYLETRQPDLAREALTRALASAPADAMTHYLLGHAYGSIGQLEQAAGCYRRALEAEPDHAKAEQFLITTESLLESREHYRNGLKLLYSPEPGIQDLNRAIRDLVQSIAIFDGSPALENLRECARRMLSVSGKTVIRVSPSPEREHWIRACERGYFCVQQNNWQGVRAAYDEALKYRTEDDFVHHALGFCFVELDASRDAVRAWLRVLELNSEYDFTRFGCVERE
jgi:tetratricopeptide (TPR) repeat protein